eukprot:2073581-Amphidinium_carterae.1
MSEQMQSDFSKVIYAAPGLLTENAVRLSGIEANSEVDKGRAKITVEDFSLVDGWDGSSFACERGLQFSEMPLVCA